MLKWLSTGALAAVTTAFALAGGDAEAGGRSRYNHAPFFYFYEPGPQWMPPPRYYYYFDEPEPDRFYEYDEGYYEPEYLRPEPAPVKPRKKLKPAVTSVPGAAKKSTAALSCDKATAIVSGYGFAAVKAEDCQGQVYAFNATRGGKAYSIKLSAMSGELTEVKKLQ